mmetsp:Transcript_16632/g.36892  ORF Transcript_16632/g.36892 Transcript_16632/m.36892 type:complete len:208 (-) Transcript_16632:260-883(-)
MTNPFTAAASLMICSASSALPLISSQRGLSGRYTRANAQATVTGMQTMYARNRHPCDESVPHARPATNREPAVQKYSMYTRKGPLREAGRNSANRSKGTEAPPMPKPASARNAISQYQLGARPLRKPPMMIIAAARKKVSFRPCASANRPQKAVPQIMPAKTVDVMAAFSVSDRPHSSPAQVARKVSRFTSNASAMKAAPHIISRRY